MKMTAGALGTLLAISMIVAMPLTSGSQEVKTQVPDFKLQTPEGETMSLKEHLEKGPVLLNFWTTWCKPCQKELPELQKLYHRYKDQGFTLFAISEDNQRTQSRVRPTVRSRKYKFPVLMDPDQKVGNLFGVRSYPTNVLISPEGKIVMNSQGYRKGDEKKMEAEIVKLLGDTAEEASGTEEAPEESEAGDDS
jgi:peroxiredoxin